MTKRERVRYDMFIRVVQFINDNIADFPSGIVPAQLAVLTAVVDRLQELVCVTSFDVSRRLANRYSDTLVNFGFDDFSVDLCDRTGRRESSRGRLQSMHDNGR